MSAADDVLQLAAGKTITTLLRRNATEFGELPALTESIEREALTFSCSDLSALLSNLKSNSQAAFRLTGTTSADDSLYAYESGFARRASGLEYRPRLVLYRGTGGDSWSRRCTSAPAPRSARGGRPRRACVAAEPRVEFQRS